MISGAVDAGMDATATPRPLVDTYDSLADTILAAKKTEWNLVHSILGGTYSHAEGVLAQAVSKIEAGQDASAEVERVAALVAQLGNEGDASVAAVRKRLLEGGHHHNAAGEEQGIYDDGFVIVTRASKKALLDVSKRIAKLGKSATVDSLNAEWDKVKKEFGKMHAGTPMGH
jgi:hypothetical protein